jgi:hypothetical protein
MKYLGLTFLAALSGCYVSRDCHSPSFGLPNLIFVCNAPSETADAFEAKIEEGVRRYADAGVFEEAQMQGRLRGVLIHVVNNTEGLQPEEVNTFGFVDDRGRLVAGETSCESHRIALANRNLCWGSLVHEIAHLAESCEEPPTQPGDNAKDPSHATWSRRGIYNVINEAQNACAQGKLAPWDRPR